MSVRRIFVEKKPAYAVKAGELREELENYLGIHNVKNVRVLIRYDIENLSEETYKKALVTIFSEPPVDLVYEEEFTRNPGDLVFSVEYLPGQFDQRADSAEQCVKLLKEDEEPVIRSATTYVVTAPLTAEQEEAIKSFCINPVDSRQADEEKPETLVTEFEVPEDILYFDGFADSSEEELKALYGTLNLAMTFKDFLHIQNYYKKEEHRDPSVTEIRVLDTYWSDHCRHTTFSTELKNVSFTDGDYREPMEETYKQYLADREVIYKGRDDKYVCLMDLALMAMKKLRSEGKLQDMEVSDEINACSIVVPVEIDGVTEEWLVNFKNETHNHPTEIEPFGGAATCLGGAIRDPLSGRTYVYQAMLQAAKRVGFGDDKRRTTKHFTEEDRKRFNKNRNSQTNQGAMRQEWDKYQRRQKALGNQIARDSTKLRTLSDKLLKARKMTQKQRAKAEESQQKLKAEQDKNKVLLQQLADRFKVERQAFIDAMVMTGVSRQDAEKRFLDYVKNKGRG